MSMQFSIRVWQTCGRSVSFSKNPVSLSEVFDEVGRLRLAKNFGFSLSVEIYSTKTTRVLRHGNGVRIVN